MADTVNVLLSDDYIREYMRTQIKAVHPEMDTSDNSVFDDIFIKPMISIMQPILNQAAKLEIKTNLKFAAAMTDAEIEDIGANNYAVYRTKGSGAKAVQTFGFSRITDRGITIPAGVTVSTPSGLMYVTKNSKYYSKDEAKHGFNPTTHTYDVTADVSAINIGENYNVGANTISICNTNFNEYLVYTSNKVAASGGTNNEDISSYVRRMLTYYVSQQLGTEPGYYSSMIEAFPTLTDIRILGYKDEGMERDVIEVVSRDSEGNIAFGDPVVDEDGNRNYYAETEEKHIGGCVDIYIRGSEYTLSTENVKIASNIIDIEGIATDVTAKSAKDNGGVSCEFVYLKQISGENDSKKWARCIKDEEDGKYYSETDAEKKEPLTPEKTLIRITQEFTEPTQIDVSYSLSEEETDQPISETFIVGYNEKIEIAAPTTGGIVSAYHTNFKNSDLKDWDEQIKVAFGVSLELPELADEDTTDFSNLFSIKKFDINLDHELSPGTENSINKFDHIYEGSSLERDFLLTTVGTMLTRLPNSSISGDSIAVMTSANKTIKEAHDMLYTRSERIITTDVMVKEAIRKPVNIMLEVRTRNDAEITSLNRSQIYAAIEELFDNASINGQIEQSDIVGKLYTNSETSRFIEYVRLPLAAFYSPENTDEEIEEQEIPADLIKSGAYEYLYLNKLIITQITGD